MTLPKLIHVLRGSFVEVSLVLGEQGDSLEHRLRFTFSAWALMGFMQRWLSLTDWPITEMLPNLSKFHDGVKADAIHYLIGDAVL